MKKLFYLASVLALGFANAQYTGNVGINTNEPKNTLHVHSDADPLRLDGLQNTTRTGNSFLVAGDDGVVKKLDASSLKLLVHVQGGSPKWTANGGNTRVPTNDFIINNPNPEQSSSILALTSEVKNDSGAYDTTTGVFTAPEDGLYEFVAVTIWDVDMNCTIPAGSLAYEKPTVACKDKEHPIAFSGQAAKVRAYLNYKSVDQDEAVRISYVDTPFFRGARTQDQGIMTYVLPNSTTLWMKKGDTMSLRYHFFGGFDVLTKADPYYPQNGVEGAKDLNRISIRGGKSTYLKVFKVLY